MLFARFPSADLDLKRLAQAQEVVGGVVESHESAFQSADAAVQADAVLAFFVDLQRQVDQPVFLVQLAMVMLGSSGFNWSKYPSWFRRSRLNSQRREL